jgi:CheY-like chemotaxis protein
LTIAAEPKLILVIDDELDIATIIKNSLQRYGYDDVFAFTNPHLALEHFRINFEEYRLVISDIRMPGMNGFEFVRSIREIRPDVKILLMTAFVINDLKFPEFLPYNKVNGILQKPVSPKELIKVVRKHLIFENKITELDHQAKQNKYLITTNH